jgi:mono/diheme cytochrome c family protein
MFRYVKPILFGLLLAGCAFGNPLGSPASAADASAGKALAERWCSSCHVVNQGQKSATDQAPPFASIARMPNFGAAMLTYLLLKPHPNMPRLELSRTEAADLAEYIATLK